MAYYFSHWYFGRVFEWRHIAASLASRERIQFLVFEDIELHKGRVAFRCALSSNEVAQLRTSYLEFKGLSPW